MTWMKMTLRRHYLAFILTIIVGLINVGPHVAFRFSLGDEYKGIYPLLTANETEYLSEIQEVLDGHVLTASTPFYEYKQNVPLYPPTVYWFYAFFAKLFGASPSIVVLVSKFFLPAILFLFVYAFVRAITDEKDSFGNKLNAAAAGLLVVLGYDLIQYQTLWSYLKGTNYPTSFLLWTRLVNPITGALFLFPFLLVIWNIFKRGTARVKELGAAAILLALMMGTYFFSWTLALSVLGWLAVVSIIKRDYRFLKRAASIVGLAILFSLPYWYMVYVSSQSPYFLDAALRTGLFLGHHPILNKFLVATAGIFAIFTFVWRKRKLWYESWWQFCAAIFLAGFLVYNQQIFTGRTIWYFHYAQYTVPLSLIAIIIFFYQGLRRSPRFWMGIASAFAVVSIAFGVYTQVSAYTYGFTQTRDNQKYAAVFDWINRNTSKDCVIATTKGDVFAIMITAFTHCNIYDTDFNYFLIPFDRLYHNFFIRLRLRGIGAGDIDEYTQENQEEILVGLLNVGGLVRGRTDPAFTKIMNQLPGDYKNFLKSTFRSEFDQYKINYLISEGPLAGKLQRELAPLELVERINNQFIYEFKTLTQ